MSVVTLADAKTHLNITVSTYDTELQGFIDSAEVAIANRVGPLSSTAVTESVKGGTDTLCVTTTPLISVTSVTDNYGTALVVGDLNSIPAGCISYKYGMTFSQSPYTVVYQAGRTSLPADLKNAVLELVRHLWTSQRGAGTRRSGTGEQAGTSIPAYLLPYAVQELIAPYMQSGA